MFLFQESESAELFLSPPRTGNLLFAGNQIFPAELQCHSSSSSSYSSSSSSSSPPLPPPASPPSLPQKVKAAAKYVEVPVSPSICLLILLFTPSVTVGFHNLCFHSDSRSGGRRMKQPGNAKQPLFAFSHVLVVLGFFLLLFCLSLPSYGFKHV